ncbi:MAG: carbohydrate ABC transporter permease [Lachnospiraceae bacterium]|nr:carbohydrate ABC transporter permease [Lachnospiraceae bacterium]
MEKDSSLRGRGDKIFQVVCYIVLTILALSAVLPFLMLLSSSFTDNGALRVNGYGFWPSVFSTYAYEYMFQGKAAQIFRSYGITFFITIFGTVISLLIGPMFAYTMSRRDYKRARFWTVFVFFTMLFNGGVVPSYMMWTQIFNIKNTIWALIFPNLIANGFFIILYKNNFSSNIHPALIEAAKIDGASEFFIYRKIVLPLSLPILATVGLMTGLGYWNDWTNGIYYITEEKWYSLQVYLNSILSNIQAMQSMNGAAAGGQFPGVSIRMAMAVIGVVPIMILYPFFQKYFVKGIAIGGVKE